MEYPMHDNLRKNEKTACDISQAAGIKQKSVGNVCVIGNVLLTVAVITPAF